MNTTYITRCGDVIAVNDYNSNFPIIYPTGIKRYNFIPTNNIQLPLISNTSTANIPSTVTHLFLGYEYNQPLPILPTNITHLTFVGNVSGTREGPYKHHITIPDHITHLKTYYPAKLINPSNTLQTLVIYFKFKYSSLNITIGVTLNEIPFNERLDLSNTSVLMYYASCYQNYVNYSHIKMLQDRIDINTHNTCIRKTPFYDLND